MKKTISFFLLLACTSWLFAQRDVYKRQLIPSSKSDPERNTQSTSNPEPNLPSDLDWTKPEFDDSNWKEEIYGYGPQVETKAEGMSDWETVSFSWQYGVWDNPGGQGYHGLKGKVDDRFFILDKGKNQQFRTHVYAPENGGYRIETDGVKPDRVRIDGEEVDVYKRQETWSACTASTIQRTGDGGSGRRPIFTSGCPTGPT